ncbi:MAG: methyltransferase domain-containing protein [Deltaproteobacteria bacterium]|nr:methyltransferase domain-containing protein [Deltaproteobacteria bacterium]MBW2388742.1 methyltransferase domain-containing protein [Deltaproteobacteria bacterium]MBW2725421.1 methyltransferase domain-containing protein [Deltaproteobacteria bacterium]
MPATAYWRIYEAEVILRGLRGSGRGLDLGCGDGSFASILFPAAPELTWTGVEQDGVDAELARRSGQYEEVCLTRGEDMPFDDECFDLVFSNCVLEHIEGLDEVLEHVGRMLKPGGQFIFTVPSEDFYDALVIPRLFRLLGLFRAHEWYVAHLDRRLEILNLLTLEEWEEKLSNSGLMIRSEVPYATRWAASLWELIATLTGGVAYWVAQGRTTPRKIQQSAGLVNPDRGWIGTICFAALLPVIVLSAVQRNQPPYAGRLVVAVKEGQA